MKKVCVIGCNGDIGNSICLSLRENGYYIIGTDKQDKSNANIDYFFMADLSFTDQVINFCKRLIAQGELWAIVFSAGIYPLVNFKDYNLELWEEVMNVNLRSSFIIAREVSSKITFGGRMVFISSGASFLGSKDIGYSVSKFGIQGLAKGLAKNFANKILVNVVSPGLIDTKMSKRMDPERRNQTIKNILLNRPGQPSELTKAVNFLLDSHNSYMTGATIDINGGLYCR